MRLRDWAAHRHGEQTALGSGVWRNDHDRYERAVLRYREVMVTVPSRPLRIELDEIAETLEHSLSVVRGICESAQRTWPSHEPELPEAPLGLGHLVHREVGHAATLVAHLGEYVLTAWVAARRRDEHAVHAAVDDARAATKRLRELLDELVPVLPG